MLFSSLFFVFGFLPVVLFLYYAVFRKRTHRNVLLTVASLLFYTWGEPSFAPIFMASILCNWLFGLLVSLCKQKNRKVAASVILVFAVLLNLALLGYYKYLGFILQNVGVIFHLQIPYREIVLPIGISFFTFQGMSYVFDVHRGNGEVQKNPLNVALYIAFFPQLIAGPIVRYETVAEQINDRNENLLLFSSGVRRFIEGLAKKVILSNSLALIVDKAFGTSDYAALSVLFAWLGALCYCLQIFFDFSGYSDMAIGLGRMFGFRFLENFNFPYISASISDFWRRWHISLGSWFRDYVYFPLGGSKVSTKSRLVFNLLVVWLLTGIWHGASWNFVVWGCLHFALIAFEKLTGIPKCFRKPFTRLIYRCVTLFVVLIGWVIFRAPDLCSASSYIIAMFGGYGNALSCADALLYFRENLVLIICSLVFATPIVSILFRLAGNRITNPVVLVFCKTGFYTVLLLLFIVSVSYFVKGSYNPFIYFNF